MSRATIVYLFMALCLVAGLSAILALGSGLRAPPDLSGTWEIEPDPRAVVAPEPAALGRWMTLEQSGRFVRLQFERGQVVDLKLVGEKSAVAGGKYVHTMEFSGPDWALAVEGEPAMEVMRMDLLGPISLSFAARRTQRTYPGHGGTRKPSTRPAAQSSSS
jgi:hypothetical protein